MCNIVRVRRDLFPARLGMLEGSACFGIAFHQSQLMLEVNTGSTGDAGGYNLGICALVFVGLLVLALMGAVLQTTSAPSTF